MAEFAYNNAKMPAPLTRYSNPTVVIIIAFSLKKTLILASSLKQLTSYQQNYKN